MKEVLERIHSLWEQDAQFKPESDFYSLVAATYQKIRKGRTYKQIAEMMGIPIHLVIKYGRYGEGGYIGIRTKEWVRKRDGNKCRNCGSSKEENPRVILHTHHINSARNHNPTNLITLCNSCHKSFHGIKNASKEAYMECINEIKI